MEILEKLDRIQVIGEEIRSIKMTLEILRQMATTNVRTAERCMMIASRLDERMDALYKEFEELRTDINKFVKEFGAEL